MSGIYIHIPFCRKVCYYCDFHFTVSYRNAKSILSCIIFELKARKSTLNGEIIDTVYFGGGTPSSVDISYISEILNAIYDNFQVSVNAEITLEANPDDLSEAYLRQLRSLGINRLSIGIQSFTDWHLEWMNRRHNADQSEACIEQVKNTGFKNFSIDLIYGIPGQTIEEWNHSLDIFFRMDIPHLSAYHLTIEPKTVFGVKKKRGELFEIEEEDSIIQYQLLTERTSDMKYLHYEISNFAREGMMSKHNLGYWRNCKYLGVGPGAHSYDGKARRWNSKIHKTYMEGLASGVGYYEEEILSQEEQFNDYILTNLRTMWGIDKNYIIENFGNSFLERVQKATIGFTEYITAADTHIQLNSKGMLIADRIASAFFMV